jgi:hypothetical protein
MKVRKRAKGKSDYDEYAIYCFRLTHEQKKDLTKRLALLKSRLNKNRAQDERVLKINEIILEALRIGLPQVKIEVER